MVDRVMTGLHPTSGVVGFWVSKPGIDVKTANVMQMAFTSDVKIPKIVVQGSVVSGPTSGSAPSGVTTRNGAIETVTTVSYGRTLGYIPFVAAIATASDWTLPLSNDAAQLGYLANQWHTYIREDITNFAVDTIYGVSVQRQNPISGSGKIDVTWASAKFVPRVFNDRVEFRTNCRSNLTIKYLVLEQP